MNKLCDYGCGRDAIYHFKNGKWCCSKKVNSCPALKRTAWNKGKKLTGEKLIHFRDKLAKSGRKNTGRASTPEKEEERKLKISKTMLANKKCGGYRPGSGRSISGWYKGYWCDSSWELAYVIYNLDHNIKFKRNNKSFTYFLDNKQRKYFPDFILEDNSYVEIKGRDSDNEWKCKLEYFPKNIKLIVINYITIKPYLKYAENKYGKNFTELYESRNYCITSKVHEKEQTNV